MGFVPHLLPLITTKTLVWGWYPVLVQTGPGSSAEPRETNIEKTGLDIVVLLRGPLCLSTRSSLGSLGFYFFVSLGGGYWFHSKLVMHLEKFLVASGTVNCLCLESSEWKLKKTKYHLDVLRALMGEHSVMIALS